MHVVDMVFFMAKSEPHHAAVVQPDMVTTYQGLADAIESIGDRIDRLNLDKSEPIAVSLANPSFLIATAFAILRCGYSVALASPSLYPQLQPAGIRNLIYDTHGLVLSGGRNVRFDASWLPRAGVARTPYRHRPVGNVNAIRFTSGTTGLPKTHVQTKAALEQRQGCPATNRIFGSRSKALIMPSFWSGYGFNMTCGTLSAGKTAYFAASLEESLLLINTFDIDAVIASPQQALGLAELQEKTGRLSLTSLNTLVLSGATVPPDMVRKLRDHLCRNIVNSYASTEAGTAASAPCDVIDGIPDAVGFVLPDVDLEIVDEAGVPLRTGAEGLIRLSTPYFLLNREANRPESGAKGDDRWFYPGDIGSLTEHGVLRVTGRGSDVINSGGVKVSATKIEEIVQALPEITEAAACGVMSPRGIEEVWIAVVAQGPVDVADIKKRVKQTPGVGLEPAEVFTVDQLPRGDLGKVQKYRLREQLLKLKERN